MSSVFIILFSDGVESYPLLDAYPTFRAAQAARKRFIVTAQYNPADLTIHEARMTV